MDDYISRQKLLKDIEQYHLSDGKFQYWVEVQPSADVVNKIDLLGWLLAYHTKSFELKGRYLPHEVIAWLVNDLSKDLFEDGEQNGSID